MKITEFKIHFPRKIKKQLKKLGKYPQFVQWIEIQNTTTANLDGITFFGKNFLFGN